MSTQPLSDAQAVATATPGSIDLFVVFSRLALAGFGGVLPFAYRALVERHRWLTAAEFGEFLGISQMLPGPTICNVALMVGSRFAGTRGALAALAGLIVAPFFIVIALGVAYQRYGELALFRSAIGGMASVAAGLILATALKMAISLFRKSGTRNRRAFAQAALLILAFAGLALLRWRLVVVFCVLAPLGTLVFYAMGEDQ